MAATREAPPECLDTVEEVGALYASQATRVRRLVHLRVQAPDAVVEDACQLAWLRLVVHRRRVQRAGASGWLARVAAHEALRALARADRDRPLEDDDDAPELVSTPRLLEQLAVDRSRLGAIADLSVRQQQLVWLQGLGFSYSEMAERTGQTPRTVERQLLRARRALADLDREAA